MSSVVFFLRKSLVIVFMLMLSAVAMAEGGISIQGTRIIYPLNSRQESLSIRNSSAADSFLVQSWVENADGSKSRDFVVTPPLYLSGPGNENILRLMRVAGSPYQDRESLYYFIAKAIPSVTEGDNSGKAVLRIAAASRIKLFIRPAGLRPAVDKAPAEMRFRRAGNRLEIINPTPYYITLTEIKAGDIPLDGVMVAPVSTATVSLPAASGSRITFRTINDYGAVSAPVIARFSS